MKTFSIITFFTFFCLSSLLPQAWQIEYLEGESEIRRGTRMIPADFGTPLEQGDIVSTGADAVLIISSTRNDRIKLKENSVLRLDSLSSKTEVHLQKGGIFSRIAKLFNNDSYSVTTPSIAAGVRGTEFFIAYGRAVETDPDIWLCVNEGTVAVAAAAAEVLVEAGEGVNILNGNRITPPQFYAWTKDLNWNTDPEAGAVIDNTDLSGAYSDLLDIDYD